MIDFDEDVLISGKQFKTSNLRSKIYYFENLEIIRHLKVITKLCLLGRICDLMPFYMHNFLINDEDNCILVWYSNASKAL